MISRLKTRVAHTLSRQNLRTAYTLHTWVQPSAKKNKHTKESKTAQYAPLDSTRQQLESIGVTGILVVQ